MSCQGSPAISVEGLPKNEASTEESKGEKWRNTSDNIEHLVFLVPGIRSPLNFQLNEEINSYYFLSWASSTCNQKSSEEATNLPFTHACTFILLQNEHHKSGLILPVESFFNFRLTL